jgi:hypothetical protein
VSHPRFSFPSFFLNSLSYIDTMQIDTLWLPYQVMAGSTNKLNGMHSVTSPSVQPSP